LRTYYYTYFYVSFILLLFNPIQSSPNNLKRSFTRPESPDQIFFALIVVAMVTILLTRTGKILTFFSQPTVSLSISFERHTILEPDSHP
jgi:hypothetical protein